MVYRTVQLFLDTGLIQKKQYPKNRAYKTYTVTNITEKPGIYLHEIRDELINVLLLDISVSTICNFLHDNNFNRCKLHTVAIQQDQFLRQQYICDVSIFF